MKKRIALSRKRPGSATVAMLLTMALLLLVIVTVVFGGAGAQDLSIRKLEGVRAFYAAEAGLNMALRELMLGEDEDGDGQVGTISEKSVLPWANLAVTREIDGEIVTLRSRSEAGSAARVAQLTSEYLGLKPDAMIAYGKAGDNRPAYRIWDESTQFWGAEAFANSVGDVPYWIILRGSPISNQFAMGVLGNDERITVQFWDGSAWSAPFVITADCGEKTSRVFDMAYEQETGRLVIVYRRASSNAVGYRIYDESIGWSAEFTVNLNNAAPLWIRTVPIPETDDILVFGTTNSPGNHTRHALWNGTAVVNPTSFGSGLPFAMTDYLEAAIADAGIGIAVYSANSQVPYRSFDGSNWSNATNLPSIGSRPLWNRLVAQPGGSEIVLATLSENNAITANVWNGSSWAGNEQMTASSGGNQSRNFDMAYEAFGSRPLIFYDSNANMLRYRIWNSASSTWSSQSNGPSAGSGPIWGVQAESGIESGHILVTWVTDDQQIHTAVWNGSTFSAPLTLSILSAPKERRPFMVARSQKPTNAVKVLSWHEVAPQ